VLKAAGVLGGVRVTSHPAVRGDLCAGTEERKDGRPVVCDDRVVEDGAFITSQGPGTTMEFALAIARRLAGAAAARQVAQGLVLPSGSGW
jgi:transcriptional regulator GlxA family with amidase domain